MFEPAGPADAWIETSSAEETIALGERIGSLLKEGGVVALRGGLGAGKTCLAKGIARGLGVREEVTSPTYTIISEYQGRFPFYHIDAYRLEGDEDFTGLGGEEYLGGGGVAVVEWSERLPRSLPSSSVIVEIHCPEGDRRRIRVGGLAGLEGGGR